MQEKLHLHWRLNKPSTNGDLPRLKELRRLAAEYVEADATNVSIVHPNRWPGSWHRKGEPRLARIVSKTENEIVLGEALEIMRPARREQPETTAESAAEAPQHERQDKRSTAELIANITLGRQFHPSIVPLAARWIGSGMHPGAVVNNVREFMEQVPPAQRDFRWQTRFDDVPRMVATAQEKYRSSEEQKPPDIEPIDLWAKFDPPALPRGLLPPILEQFALIQGELMGADPAGLAAAALGVCAAAIPDRVKLQVKQHDASWQESARLWIALIGDPSTKKSPILSQVVRPLARLDARLFREYCQHTAAYNALSREEQKTANPPRQKRLRIEDTTIEAAQEVLKDSPEGVLCLQDELTGWLVRRDGQILR